MDPEVNPEDVFNVLVATDIHLGYNEKDPIRGEDSFIAFEEILTIAVEKKVDFLLLGGDLFHDNKPSPKCLHKCITLMRRFCMGDSPITFEFLSDQSINFGNCPFPHVNYEDPNLNISLPVFSIHGNHDDPTVNWNLAALDLLSAAGLVNYFGCCTNLQKVEIRPLLLRKGSTHMAIFGLGSMKDERLSRLLSQEKVDIFRSKVNAENWFNLMVLHQNHVIRGTSTYSYVPEAALPNFLDLVVWGHEHECIPDPVFNPTKEFFVLQPGSSVATSLSEGESVVKHVFLLNVYGKKFRTEKIRLQTVRPFVYESISLSKFDSLQPESDDQKTTFGKVKKEKLSLSKRVEEHITEHVESMIMNAISLRTGHPKQPKLPLIRLRVEYNYAEQMFNQVRVGQHFADQVANPGDLVLLKRAVGKKVKTEFDELDEEALLDAAERARREQDRLGEMQVQSIVEKYFQGILGNEDEMTMKKRKNLNILSVKGLLEGVTRFVDKQDTDSLSVIYSHQTGKTIDFLKKENVEENEGIITDALQRYRVLRTENQAKEDEEMISQLNKTRKPGRATGSRDAGLDEDMDDDMMDSPPKRGRARGGGRGGSRGASRGRGKGRKEAEVINVSDVDSEAETQSPIRQKPAPRGRGRGTARGGRGKNVPQNQTQLSFLHKGSSDSFMSSPKTKPRPGSAFISSDED